MTPMASELTWRRPRLTAPARALDVAAGSHLVGPCGDVPPSASSSRQEVDTP